MLRIDTTDFRLHLQPASASFEKPGGSYLEWIDLHIDLMASGIQADGQWRIMPEELRRFQRQMEDMHDQHRLNQQAQLHGVERNFELTLRMLDQGAIVGDWRFQPMPPVGATVTGSCGLDQSFLPEMLREIDSLLSFTQTSNRR